MSKNWERFQKFRIRHAELGLSLDLSRMPIDDPFIDRMSEAAASAFEEMQALEGGAIANADEQRMVGHYWLRDASLAPDAEMQQSISDKIDQVENFATQIRQSGEYDHLLIVGIGGSALGPQLVADALVPPTNPIKVHFFDNTDPGGIDRTLAEIGDQLGRTLTVVISKSGGTKETRNGMLEAQHAYKEAGLDFSVHAVAVTGPGSLLDQLAAEQGWRRRFPMEDWVGGRTSVMSVVGLVPLAILGVDIRGFLEGARVMDGHTRVADTRNNAAMMLALAWHQVGNGCGEKDMVVLPYSDHLMLFSKYLQQLVMESLGKELDRDGALVNQGIAVYGNKGSTDQHAYVQQLRDGVANFFASFIEVRDTRCEGTESIDVDPDTITGDYLQGFLRGTREALTGNNRPSLTLSVPNVDARQLGALIALFERTVGYYASLVNINAYHQPGVEAGKKAAGEFLNLLQKVRQHLEASGGQTVTADQVAGALKLDPESVYHALSHLVATRPNISISAGNSPSDDTFSATDS
jgi:glucose-6-phosphate isomerase